jgi:hypothetical protein
MLNLAQSQALLRRVANRLRIAAFGRRFYTVFLALCGLYALLLVISRAGAALPDWLFGPPWMAALSGAALLLSLLLQHRPTRVEAARALDRHSGTKDLFLTLALIETSAGEYQPLVAQSAEEKAAAVKPVEVVPFRCGWPALQVALASLLIAAGVLYVPQFDPFGKVAEAAQVEQRQQRLEESRKATLARVAVLNRDQEEGEEEGSAAKKAIENLKTAFKQTKPTAKKENADALAENQKAIGGMWRKISAEKLKDLLARASEAQQFGTGVGTEKLEKWSRELQEGSTKGLENHLKEMQEDVQKLLKTKDPAARAEIERKLEKKLKELQEFNSEKLQSKPLAAALERAMKQLEMSKFEGLSEESKQALSESLELTKLELKEVAQSAQDLKELEEALKVIQMAKRLNDQQKLDGEACENCTTLEDYEELYAQMMGRTGAEGEEGDGEGMGGEGMGRGGKAEEDDAVETGFKTEQSKSAVTAGKVLMSLKTKGLSDRGEANQEYRKLVGKVKQGVSEAILQEQIPPGYHDGIKRYFDSIDKKNPPAADESEAK